MITSKKQQQNDNPIKFYHQDREYGEFSNFYKAEITVNGKVWPTSEHYFQAMKFEGTDEDYIEKIRLAETATECKRLGGSRDHPLRADW